jgi:hypothetical protein
MSATKTTRLAPIVQEAASFLRLFRVGVFEDNFLDVSRIDAGAWESARAELEAAALLTVEWDVQLAGRPYLRLPASKTPGSHPALPAAAPSVGTRRAAAAQAAARARHVEVYGALMMAVRQAFHGPSPMQGVQIMAREEANFRRAVAFARDLGDTVRAAEMGHLFSQYLARAGRAEDRDRWAAWLAGEGPDEETAALLEEPEAPLEEPAAPLEEAVVRAAPELPRPTIEAVAALPESVAVQEQEAEGARLRREGAAAVAEGQIARAAGLYQQALRWSQDTRDTAGVADTCELFGAMEEAAGRPDAARVWRERAAAKRGR